MLQIIENAKKHLNSISIISNGNSYSYNDVVNASQKFAAVLLNGAQDLNEARVAFMVNPGFDYVKVQWGIWQAGGVTVPMCLTHPLPSLQYVIEDTEATIIVVSPEYESTLIGLAEEKKIRIIVLGKEADVTSSVLPDVNPSRNAMILYTSGTTNKPKGVVTTHDNLEAQISTLVKTWEWSTAVDL